MPTHSITARTAPPAITPAPGAAEPAAPLPEMSLGEAVVEDYASLTLSLKAHPLSLLRSRLAARGIVAAASLATTLTYFRRRRQRQRASEQSHGRSVIAEIPAAEDLLLFSEDERMFHYGDQAIPKSSIIAARVLINAAGPWGGIGSADAAPCILAVRRTGFDFAGKMLRLSVRFGSQCRDRSSPPYPSPGAFHSASTSESVSASLWRADAAAHAAASQRRRSAQTAAPRTSAELSANNSEHTSLSSDRWLLPTAIKTLRTNRSRPSQDGSCGSCRMTFWNSR